jgi:hypothetical protein
MNNQRLAILITSGLGALATFMPWAKAPIIGSVSGSQSELGWVSFCLFIVSLVLSLLNDKNKPISGGILYGIIIPSLSASILGIWKIIEFNSKISEATDKVKGTFLEGMGKLAEASFSIEFGLYLVVLTGILIPIFAFLIKDKNDSSNEKYNEKIIAILTSVGAFSVYFLILLIFPLAILFYESNSPHSIPVYIKTFIFIIIGSFLPLKLSEYKKYDRLKSLFKTNLFFWIGVLVWRLVVSKFSFIYENNVQLTFIDFIDYYQYVFAALGLLSLFAETYEKKGKQIKFINNISFLFNQKILSGIIIISFLSLSTYNYFTKHIISYEEWETFRSTNNKFSGQWYFLNNDTTNVEFINFSFEADAYGRSGDVKLDYSASFNQNSNLDIKNSSPRLSMIVDYKYKLSFPIVLDSSLEIKSVDGDILKGNIFTSDKKSKEFIAYRDNNKLYSLIREKEERSINNVISGDESYVNATSDNSFTVIVNKSYFHSEPNLSYRRKGYLVNGDVGTFTEINNGFAFVKFTNSVGVVTTGWVLLSDLELNQ